MALTLPIDVIQGLQAVDRDLALAIVTLFEKGPRRAHSPNAPPPDAELVGIAGHRFLIVVNRAVVRSLPGIQIVPLDAHRAFLALDPGKGMADLEIAVVDRLEDRTLSTRERQALKALRVGLRGWRLDPALHFHTRSIIVVEQAARQRSRRPAAAS